MANQYTTQRAPLKPCGTDAAYTRHRARGEEPCAPCRKARVRASIESRQRKAAAQARRAEAQRQALEALARRHPGEFRSLYLRALSEITTS